MNKSLHDILVLVISLESEDNRRLKVYEQFDSTKFLFVNAINGKTNKNMGNKFVIPPIDAIWNSHKKAYKQFLSTNKSYCLILEDDFVILNQDAMWQKIKILTRFKPDLVQLGWLQTGMDIRLQRIYEGFTYLLFRIFNRVFGDFQQYVNKLGCKLRPSRASALPSLVIPDSFLPGAHGYLISRKFAAAVLELNNPTFLSADDFLISISRMRSFNSMRLRKSLIGQQGTSRVGSERFIRR